MTDEKPQGEKVVYISPSCGKMTYYFATPEGRDKFLKRAAKNNIEILEPKSEGELTCKTP